MSGTLIETFNWWAVERAEQPALVIGEERVSYARLHAWAESSAEWLRAEGVQSGDRVGVMAANSLQWIVLSQAAMLAGAILAPVNPRFTFSEASYLLVDRYRVKAIFHDDERAEMVAKVGDHIDGARVFNLAELDRFRDVEPRGTLNPETIPLDTDLVIIPTSGSTGRPKGVVLSHRSMSGYVADSCLARPGAFSEPKVLLFAPLCTSAGYVVLMQYLAYGGTVFLEPAFDAERALRRIVEQRITTMMGTPIFFERMAACASFQDADLSSLFYCLVGGARVSRSLLEAWLDKGVLLRQLYGQTEVGGQATFNTDQASITDPEKCGRGSVYTRVAIIDEQGDFCSPDTPGQIVIKGPGTMERYWDDPEATAATIVDGWVRTGDLGMVDEQGLLTMLDRIKDIIISGGLNISAAEVERVISEYPGVQEVAVIAAHDDNFGETPLAIVHGLQPGDIPDLLHHCGTHLSSYKVPRYMVCISDPLPRLASGKISKPLLRQEYREAHLKLTKIR
ncbi:AMP-binding protein [Marinobacter sp. NFXS9]|uniref:class I adenylate-forming enzyme family protein n=1 Tax=Marinobacter sp. NFXS9 TaxID=2818433 RepID=UPI0032DEF948